jgi:formate/nitrite transporter FocA (FNT family)
MIKSPQEITESLYIKGISFLNKSTGEIICGGIRAGVFVSLAVRVGEASKDVSGRILGYIYVIGAFVINGFEHSIANMFFIPVGIILGGQQGLHYSWQDFFINNLLPVAFGNIIGGAIFVSTVYYFMHRKYFRSENNKNARSDNYEHIKN